jgi:membrane protein YdbS with pleckstrin-like domain
VRARRNALGEHEEVLVDVRLHPLSLLRPLVLAILGIALPALGLIDEPHWPDIARYALLGVLVLALLFGAARVLGWRARRLVVTNERLIVRAGLLGRRGSEVPLRRIISLQTHQRFLERLVGRGTISIETAGEGTPFVLEEVSRPLGIARTINSAIDAVLGIDAVPERSRIGSVGEVLGRLHALYRSGFITKVELDERSAALDEHG